MFAVCCCTLSRILLLRDQIHEMASKAKKSSKARKDVESSNGEKDEIHAINIPIKSDDGLFLSAVSMMNESVFCHFLCVPVFFTLFVYQLLFCLMIIV